MESDLRDKQVDQKDSGESPRGVTQRFGPPGCPRRPGTEFPGRIGWKVSLILLVLTGCGGRPETPDVTDEGGKTVVPVGDAANGWAPPRAGTDDGKDQPAASGDPQEPARALPPDPRRHALLVGCTTYEHLENQFHLMGPANDVALAKQLLVERFQFPEENVTVLSEAGGAGWLPTRENIERQWQQLAAAAGPDSQIVVLLAGHGTQVPQSEDDADDVEADGLDEVFLPRDAGQWSATTQCVKNGITDNQLRRWVRDILVRGASLWLIIDACHSGTMARDSGDDVRRVVSPQVLGVPEAMLQEARSAAALVSGAEGDESQWDVLGSGKTRSLSRGNETGDDLPTFVAFYAAQSTQPTVEARMPRLGDNRKYFGLLTYTLSEVLTRAESPVTYRELVQRIHQQYIDRGRFSPTPSLEGTGIDREVLGSKSYPERARILIRGSRFTGWRINAGGLHGLTPDSVLAVYPPAGAARAEQPIGHVRMLAKGFQAIGAEVEPCPFEGLPAPATLAAGMRCRPVYVDLGDQRLAVGVDATTAAGETVPANTCGELQAVLVGVADEQPHLVRAVSDPADAVWLLRYDSLAEKRLFLVPVSGWHGDQDDAPPPLFGPVPAADPLPVWLGNALTRIARGQSLLRIAGGVATPAGHAGSGGVQVELVLYTDETDPGEQVVRCGSRGLELYDGDRVGFRISNSSPAPQDVTVLLIDSGYGIASLYPLSGETNRLLAGENVERAGTITADFTAVEHLVVIAVQGLETTQPVSFAFLTQPTITRARDAAAVSYDSPLGKLFEQALYGQGSTRGISTQAIGDYQLQTISWTTRPSPRPTGAGHQSR